MIINDESLYGANLNANKLSQEIYQIKKEIEKKELMLSEEIGTSAHKYNVNLEEAASVLNEIAALRLKIRFFEEQIHDISMQEKLSKDKTYKMELHLNIGGGRINFFVNTRGRDDEIVFEYDGAQIKRHGINPVSNSQWSQNGKKIQKSTLWLLDKVYVLYENGDFVYFPKPAAGKPIPSEYDTKDIICNVRELE